MSNDELIRQQLYTGEQLLWSGKPRSGYRPIFDEHVGASLFIVVFLVIWTSIPARSAILDLLDVEKSVNLYALGMASFGVFMIMYAVMWYPWWRMHSFYALTDQHVIVKTGAFAPSIKRLPLSRILHIELREHDDGSGTIGFPDFTHGSGRGAYTPRFERIINARGVYTRIREAQENANRR